MKSLKNQIACICTLLVFLAGGSIALLCKYVYAVPFTTTLLDCVLPVTIIAFVVSMCIGNFLTEPLSTLVKKTQAFKKGVDVEFTKTGKLSEADEIAECLTELHDMTKTRTKDLAIKEKRQTDFISDVAHELRTPLTAIRGNAEMLQDPDLPPELHEKFCSIIIRESERLSRLTKDLLTLQRIEGATAQQDKSLARIDLKQACTEVVDMLNPILKDRGANVEIQGEAPDILGNYDQIKQVIQNLVENSSRFIEPGGHITVELCGLSGNSVLSVKDDGCGFGDIDPSLLFDRFYRTDLSRSRGTGGTGLGLSIVKSIVERHDGTVKAVNLPEKGACFIVVIPSISS
jgi:two-component system, OmpR family, sensor kinase